MKYLKIVFITLVLAVGFSFPSCGKGDIGNPCYCPKFYEITGLELKFEKFKITLDEIEIPHIYFDGNKRFEHILLSYGIKDTFIVIVTNTDKIIGYHILNLKEKYEL